MSGNLKYVCTLGLLFLLKFSREEKNEAHSPTHGAEPPQLTLRCITEKQMLTVMHHKIVEWLVMQPYSGDN